MLTGNTESILIMTIAGVFLLFCIVMAFGGHVMPTGAMVRSPTRRGDILIGLFSLFMIIAMVWFSYYGWRYLWGAPIPDRTPPQFLSVTVSGGLTNAGFLAPDALQHPADAKKQAREFCEKNLAVNPGFPQCVLFLWTDARFVPKTLPVPSANLGSMAANYVYNRAGKNDRFCWLTGGQVSPDLCF